jgi:serine/threonine-protein kinase HSL1, negative regulator of Swe1 kinase
MTCRINQEKFFYNALLRHRNEHLEDFAGMPPGVSHSASDHHHAHPTDLDNMPLLPRHQRTKSQYSILNNEHLYSKHSFYEPPSSDGSYDPFRASRDAIIASKGGLSVTVHRSSSNSNCLHKLDRESLRIRALRKNSRKDNSSKPSSCSKRVITSTASLHSQRFLSRASLASSSGWPSSPPIISKTKPYKRGVSFMHLRRSSMCHGQHGIGLDPSTLTSDGQSSANTICIIRESPSSEVTHLHQAETSFQGKETGAQDPNTPNKPISQGNRLIYPKADSTPTYMIDKEARKVSTELDKLCEEAFFRSSIGSSIQSSVSDKQSPFSETPASSVSNNLLCVGRREHFRNRPLPPLPDETPSTFITRELAQTRERLAKRYEVEGNTTANFSEVLARLDVMLQPVACQASDSAIKRVVSTPYPHYQIVESTTNGHLPMITEENDIKENCFKRSVTDPTQHRNAEQMQRKRGRRDLRDADNLNGTIRVVNTSSPSPIVVAPLNIRKRSGASTVSQPPDCCSTPPFNRMRVDTTPTQQYLEGNPMVSLKGTQQSQTVQATLLSSECQDMNRVKKKNSWFYRRKVAEEDSTEVQRGPYRKPSKHWTDLDDRLNRPVSKIERNKATEAATTYKKPSNNNISIGSEFPIRRQHGNSTRNGFLKWIGKLGKSDKDKFVFNRGMNDYGIGTKSNMAYTQEDTQNDSTTSFASTYDYTTAEPAASRTDDYQRNWLARFLHIKPASRIVCFHVGRGRARQEIVRLLRDWKSFGVRDITFDRAKNTVQARIAKVNHLNIKPVSFVVELFVVLEHGKRAQLSVARFTQVKGAKSSFEKVVNVMQEVCHANGLLVKDEEKRKAMAEILT